MQRKKKIVTLPPAKVEPPRFELNTLGSDHCFCHMVELTDKGRDEACSTCGGYWSGCLMGLRGGLGCYVLCVKVDLGVMQLNCHLEDGGGLSLLLEEEIDIGVHAVNCCY